ncbi:MAG: Hsp70 family protein [Planctomycetia bacterium]|nr:Hsp70 family protein [Planctomycetia bacterium]
MEFNPGLTVGIDLGTTFSTIAHLDENGTPVALLNDDGKDETPSLILLADSGRVIVGPNRMRAAMEDPQNVVERIKRHMGKGDFKRTFDGREITPEFLSALILKKLRQDAEPQIGQIGNAVITVPYYFNDLKRKATQDAGQIAGLRVVDIINEPTAATLTYAWKRGELGSLGGGTPKPRLVLVYDLGGGTFDVTVVRYTPSHFQVLATDGDVELGGVDWNDRLVDHVAEQFKAKFGSDIRESAATMQLLLYECDQAKIFLSAKSETTINCRHDGKSLNVTITREQFETLTADLLQRSIDTSEQVLEQAGIRSTDLDALVLVGGSTLMPAVTRRLEEGLKVKPFQGLSPYTSVAQGAAIHAAILEAKHRGTETTQAGKLRKLLAAVKQENVNSHALGVAVRNPRSNKRRNYVMIPRNSRLPLEVRQTFVTTQDAQQSVNVEVLQGEAPDPNACDQIGNCRIAGLPEGLPKGSPIEVVYAFDESGRIHVRAEDKTGGRVATTAIERPGGMDQAKIDLLSRLASDYHVE